MTNVPQTIPTKPTAATQVSDAELCRAEHLILFYLPPLLCMGLIFYLSSRSWVPIPLPGWMIIRDKTAHAIMYGILCYLWIRAFRAGDRKPISIALCAAAVLITTAYGISDEYHQSFVPGRTATVGDALADSAGAILSGAVLFVRQGIWWAKDRCC